MKNQYFDNIAFNKAVANMVSYPEAAKEMFEEYIKLYPKDYAVYSYYATTLYNLRLYNEAQEAINRGEQLVLSDTVYEPRRRERFEKKMTFPRVALLIRNGEFEKAIDIIERQNDDTFNDEYGYRGAYFYCKKMLGMLKCDEGNLTYLFSQIKDYSDDKFLEHTKKHISGNIIDDAINPSVFYESFPFMKIFYKIKEMIPNDKATNHGFFEDIYIFKYDNCGRCDNKIVDYFCVITFMNTNNFITMYPTVKYHNLPYVDLNYLNDDKPKIKRLSQIDKFNLKYKK